MQYRSTQDEKSRKILPDSYYLPTPAVKKKFILCNLLSPSETDLNRQTAMQAVTWGKPCRAMESLALVGGKTEP